MNADYLARLLNAAAISATPAELPEAKRTVDISTLRRQEQRWAGPEPEWLHAVPNKPALQFGDQPMWAEFILLRLLESDGWSGAWVKNWGGSRAFWRNPRVPVELPPTANSLFRRIEERSGGRGGGCWDIFAWRDEDILFIARVFQLSAPIVKSLVLTHCAGSAATQNRKRR